MRQHHRLAPEVTTPRARQRRWLIRSASETEEASCG